MLVEVVEGLHLNIDHISSIIYDKHEDTYEVSLLSSKIVHISPEAMHTLEGLTKGKKPVKKSSSSRIPQSGEAVDLLQELHTALGGTRKVIPTENRIKKLRGLLSQGFDRDSLLLAATNMTSNPFLMGENKSKTVYATIDYLLKPEKAAKYAEEGEQTKKNKVKMFHAR